MVDQAICSEPQAVQSETLVDRLCQLRAAVFEDAERILADYLPNASTTPLDPSIRNLAHYLALRRRDIRSIQENLAQTGVSSLGRCESHVMATFDQVISILREGYRKPGLCRCNEFGYPNFNEGRVRLERNTVHLFGASDSLRQTRIMVTLPTEAAYDGHLIQDLVARGMDCARINCAHDTPDIWLRMIEKITAAKESLGRECRILMDLAGQKIRTCLIPRRTDHIYLKAKLGDAASGLLLVRLVPGPAELAAEGACLVIPADVYAQLRVGDRLIFEDAHGRRCCLDIVGRDGDDDWIVAASRKTAIIASGTVIEHQRQGGPGEFRALSAFNMHEFPATREERRLFVGDSLLLYRRTPSLPLMDGRVSIGCTHSEIVDQLSPGHTVWFDDGKIGTRVMEMHDDFVALRVTHARPTGVRLRGDKGINFPDIHLELPCLTDKDLSDLNFACHHADMIGFSFVQSAADMHALMDALDARDGQELAIVAKIETRTAVKNLPEILFSALPRYRLGVMIARGDLAVELGSERMAEIQEELLWLCEAAHVPVIWATQVLESLVKKGISTRPELTDAAMSARAECAMLNKGPHILQGVATLDGILTRMQDHQYKKVARMRALQW